MAELIEWRAFVTLTRRPPTTDDRLERLIHALPGYGIVTGTGDRLTIAMTVQAATLRQATDAALKAAREAHAVAFNGTPGQARQLRVLMVEDYNREVAHPDDLELVGLAEAAAMLKVTHQRVAQLADDHPEFPAPVATLKQGRVFTRSSVERFNQTWQRRPGRPPASP